MSKPIEYPSIREPVEVICRLLGLVPNNVAELAITPRAVVATVYKLNEHGSKYVEPTNEMLPSDDPDEESTGFSSRPATETHTFEVTT